MQHDRYSSKFAALYPGSVQILPEEYYGQLDNLHYFPQGQHVIDEVLLIGLTWLIVRMDLTCEHWRSFRKKHVQGIYTRYVIHNKITLANRSNSLGNLHHLFDILIMFTLQKMKTSLSREKVTFEGNKFAFYTWPPGNPTRVHGPQA